MPNQRNPDKKLVAFFVPSAMKDGLRREAKMHELTISGYLRQMISANLSSIPYWVHRNGQNFGAYKMEQLRIMYESGQLSPVDWVIAEGGSSWNTVASVISGA